MTKVNILTQRISYLMANGHVLDHRNSFFRELTFGKSVVFKKKLWRLRGLFKALTSSLGMKLVIFSPKNLFKKTVFSVCSSGIYEFIINYIYVVLSYVRAFAHFARFSRIQYQGRTMSIEIYISKWKKRIYGLWNSTKTCPSWNTFVLYIWNRPE